MVEIIAIFSNNEPKVISASSKERCVEIAERLAKKCGLELRDYIEL